MLTQVNEKMQKLYAEDFVLWTEITSKQIEQRDIENLDWEHLLEEIIALGSEQKRKVDSYLRQLLIHLLLYSYWESEKDYCQKGWENEIDNFRFELELLFRSKTLYNYFLEEIDVIYPKARKRAIKKTGLSSQIFPQKCPFTVAQLLDNDYLP
ncbi:MAG: DUF29 domain-containing protein [Gomphosphaeria aponina SAG 52.96 = DSM 107014]|uniref:DUF29 domain-containing protein n=1 Tax=Gomphosphaeria aponina SAG 52.96 = DSM 107014 TaxID=1521640 RepID=A0A941JKZ2_9CHRO|nr:DUF29 domain-containing protein [Gomphosphaeria aponina SAG 52.96 = DSM 107014]